MTVSFVCRAQYATFVVRPTARSVEVSVAGEVDIACDRAAQQIIEHVGELIADDGRRPVYVDLSAVTFFDAAGIAFLLRLERVTQIAATDFAVHGTSPLVRRVLDVVGLNHLIEQASHETP